MSRLGFIIGYTTTTCAPQVEQSAFENVDTRIEGYALPVSDIAQRFVVIATQSKGYEAALRAIIDIDADYKAFVGSRRKSGVDPEEACWNWSFG